MQSSVIYKDDSHEWILFGRDPEKPDKIIDTNQYMVKTSKSAVLLDPGGVELFSPMLSAVLRHVPMEQIKYLFASHQDPDIISSLGLWDKTLTDATLYSTWLWESFIRHFGMENTKFEAIRDEGGSMQLDELQLQFIPAHYLHSSGNFHVYDPKANILMSGDIGAAMEAEGAPLFVEDFGSHIDKMKGFHQRWMPSNRAKNDWVRRVRELEIDMMAPQHGRIFKGDHVQEFLDWFEKLEVATAV